METKYLHMSIEELVEDTDFILAIQSKQQLSNWSDWLLSQNNEVQKRVNKARMIVSSLSLDIKEHTMKDSTVEQLWSRIDHSTKEVPTIKVEKKSTTIPIWAYIASMAAAIALLVFVSTGNKDYEIINSSETNMALALPSASKVSLNNKSSIKYDEKQWKMERNIDLDGSASFDVTKGVPFNIYTSEGSVHVLGTAFDVVERESVFLVAVERGLVRVESGLINMKLEAGMTFLKNPKFDEVKKLSGTKSTSVDLQNRTLAEAKQIIEHMYSITFEGMDSEDDRSINVGFDSSDLETALRKVIWNAGMKYEITGNIVTLSK